MFKWFKSKPKVEREPEPRITGYILTIVYAQGSKEYTLVLGNRDPRLLRKVYLWYLLRDSEKYNLRYRDGMTVMHRHEILSIKLDKVNKVESYWQRTK